MQSGGVSSLIFLVVIGVWAAYFIQYWVRRRDHLATARSVDQFSESMRVLERRTPLPAADLSAPQRRSESLGADRPPRAQLLVRRAATSAATLDAGAAADDRLRGEAGPDPTRRPAVVTARRNRALVMVGALSTWLVAVPLVVLGMLAWSYLAVPVLSVVVALAWVRRSARSRAARATPASARSRSTVRDTLTVRPGDQRVVPTRPAQAAPVGGPIETGPAETGLAETGPADTELAEAGPADTTATTKRLPGELYDLEAIEAASADGVERAAAAVSSARPARPLVDEDDIPLTWEPVPVPRPTYTLKARATRPAPAAADLVGDADTEYAAREDDLPVRQVAGA